MAQQVNLTNKNTNQIRQGYMGFSWTTLFFSAFVALFRSDWKWFFIMFLVNIVTAGVASLVFCFIYNKAHLKSLLQDGYTPEGSEEFATSVYAYTGIPKPKLEE